MASLDFWTTHPRGPHGPPLPMMESRLSAEDRSFIAKHPFADELDSLRSQLSTAAISIAPWQHDAMEATLLLTKLLITFMTNVTAARLRLPDSENSLASDLGRIIERIDPNKSRSTSLDHGHFQHLVKAVLDHRSDAEIWEVVYALVETCQRPDSALSCSSAETIRALEFPQPPSKTAADRKLVAQALSDKVYIADVVQRNDFFFPFEPAARPKEVYKQREAFAQAILRDLDRLYIRIIDQQRDYEAFRKITKGVRSLGPQFALWRFEVVLFHVVKKLDIVLSDFEVFRGLQAWKDMRKERRERVVPAEPPRLPEINKRAL